MANELIPYRARLGNLPVAQLRKLLQRDLNGATLVRIGPAQVSRDMF